PDEVMQPGGADAADVHSGTLADRLEALENGDVSRGIARGRHGYNAALRRPVYEPSPRLYRRRSWATKRPRGSVSTISSPWAPREWSSRRRENRSRPAT